jgi:predicted permease
MIWSRTRSFIRNIRYRTRLEEEMSDEVRFHIERRTEDLMARKGLSRSEAYRQARLEFGSIEKYKEEGRRARGLQRIEEIRADIKFAVRTFRKHPGFTFAAIATLALGIGANTAVFSAVDTVLFRSLPVTKPGDLVAFNWVSTPNSMLGPYSGSGRRDPVTKEMIRTSFSYLTFQRFRENTKTLSDVFAFDEMGMLNVIADNRAHVASAQLVTGAYFTGFGVRSSLGRTILPADDDPRANPVTVISHRYWQRRFAESPHVLGKVVKINGATFTIVGVTPPEFFGTRFGEAPDVFVPMSLQARTGRDQTAAPWEWWIQIMGRMKPGVTQEQVLADLTNSFDQSVREAWDRRPANYRAPRFQNRSQVPELRVIAGERGPLGPERDAVDMLPIFFGIVGMVLLIVCTNLANLFLARASTRQQEISVRCAIGASRLRVIRQFLTESVLLALGGGLAGVILAYWGKDFLSLLPATSSLTFDTKLDLRVLLFSFTLSLMAGVVFGVGAAIKATQVDLGPTIRISSQKGGSRSLVRKSLLVAQMAISLVLLAGAGLFINTVINLRRVDLGFKAKNLLLFDISNISPRQVNGDAGQLLQIYEGIVESTNTMPGVEATTFSAIRPLGGGAFVEAVTIDDGPETQDRNEVFIHTVRSNFFETLGVPLLRGRGFSQGDNASGPKVAVINQTMATQVFRQEDPLGRHFRFTPTPESGSFTVIGIVSDSKHSGLRGNVPPTVYLPATQNVPGGGVTFEVRTTVPPASLIPAIRQAVNRVDPDLPVSRINTQTEQIEELLGVENTLAFFSGIFSVVALLLASIGLYGIVSFRVGRRTSEIGVRMALGARRRDVVWLVMRETMMVLMIGAVLGLTGSLVLGRLVSTSDRSAAEFVRQMLYGIAPDSVSSLLVALLVLGSVAAFAGYLPARRASSINPVSAVRYE